MEGNKRVRRRRRNTVERLKNLLILLLTLSAVVLTVRVLMFNGLVDKGPRGWLDHLLSLLDPGQSVPADDPEATGQAGAAAQPVRIAVCDGVDRFAVQYDPAQADRLFSSVGILLSEALSSAASPHTVPESAWRDALQAPGVWFDFLGELPLEALYAWMGEGGSNPSLTATARQLAVAQDLDGGVSLYYHNESDGLYYACETEVAYTGHMDELVSGHGSNGAFFVFELEADRGYAGLDPYVLLTSATPSPLVYHSANPLSSPDEATVSALQAAVSFQTQSDALYEIPGGLRLRVGRETLEIGNDGTVSYHTSEDAASRHRNHRWLYGVGASGNHPAAGRRYCGRLLRRCPTLPDGYHRRGRRHHRGLLWLQPERSGRSPSRGRLRRPVHGAERTDHRLYPALPPL